MRYSLLLLPLAAFGLVRWSWLTLSTANVLYRYDACTFSDLYDLGTVR